MKSIRPDLRVVSNPYKPIGVPPSAQRDTGSNRAVRGIAWAAFVHIAVGGPILMILFSVIGQRDHLREHCRNIATQISFPVQSEQQCLDTLAQKGVCSDHRGGELPLVATLSSTAEWWPFVTIFVLGPGISALFGAQIYFAWVRDSDVLYVLSAVAVLASFGVLGSSVLMGDNTIGWAHYILTALFCISVLGFWSFFYWDDHNLWTHKVGLSLLAVLYLSCISMLVGMIVANLVSNSFTTVVSIGEILLCLSYAGITVDASYRVY